jgi:hypothetical protein
VPTTIPLYARARTLVSYYFIITPYTLVAAKAPSVEGRLATRYSSLCLIISISLLASSIVG